MIAAYLILAPLVLGLGSIIGFFFLDKKRFSKLDFQLGTIAFVLVNLLVLIFYRDYSLMWLHMLILWILLVGGIVVGEYVRYDLIGKAIGKSVQKRDVEKSIESFTRQASKTALIDSDEEDEKALKEDLQNLLHQVDRLKSHALYIKNNYLYKQLTNIEESCLLLTRLCLKYNIEQSDLQRKCYQLARELSDVSMRVLCETENETQTVFTKHAFKPLMYAVKKDNTVSNTK